MPSEIRIRKVPGRWVVRSDGAVLAETSDALELEDSTGTAVMFFPQSDVAMAFLDEGAHTDRALGQSTWFALVDASATTPEVAWSLHAPTPEAERLAGHITFDATKVTVERL